MIHDLEKMKKEDHEKLACRVFLAVYVFAFVLVTWVWS